MVTNTRAAIPPTSLAAFKAAIMVISLGSYKSPVNLCPLTKVASLVVSEGKIPYVRKMLYTVSGFNSRSALCKGFIGLMKLMTACFSDF